MLRRFRAKTGLSQEGLTHAVGPDGTHVGASRKGNGTRRFGASLASSRLSASVGANSGQPSTRTGDRGGGVSLRGGSDIRPNEHVQVQMQFSPGEGSDGKAPSGRKP